MGFSGFIITHSQHTHKHTDTQTSHSCWQIRRPALGCSGGNTQELIRQEGGSEDFCLGLLHVQRTKVEEIIALSSLTLSHYLSPSSFVSLSLYLSISACPSPALKSQRIDSEEYCNSTARTQTHYQDYIDRIKIKPSCSFQDYNFPCCTAIR